MLSSQCQCQQSYVASDQPNASNTQRSHLKGLRFHLKHKETVHCTAYLCQNLSFKISCVSTSILVVPMCLMKTFINHHRISTHMSFQQVIYPRCEAATPVEAVTATCTASWMTLADWPSQVWLEWSVHKILQGRAYLWSFNNFITMFTTYVTW